MKKIGLFLDAQDLHFCLKRRFHARLNYQKYMEYVVDLGEVATAIVYGCSVNNNTKEFIDVLKSLGFTAKFFDLELNDEGKVKWRTNLSVNLTLDVTNTADKFDRVIIGSSDPDLIPVINHLQAKGIETIILACMINPKVKDVCRCIEIPQSFTVAELVAKEN